MKLHKIRSFYTKRKHEQSMTMVRRAVQCSCFLVLLFGAVAVQAQEPGNAATKKPAPANSPVKIPNQPVLPQKIVEQGIAIELTVDPNAKNATTVTAGEDANVKFKVTDTTTGRSEERRVGKDWRSR